MRRSWLFVALLAGLIWTGTLAAQPALSPPSTTSPTPVDPAKPEMNLWQAVVLGVVEGVTEYLPISSTGHLIVTQRLMGIPVGTPQEKDAADAFAICIQAGAILAVLGLYFPSVRRMTLGLLGRDPDGLKLAISLVTAFLPAMVAGLLLSKPIKAVLFGMWPVVFAWIIGGIAILLVARKPKPSTDEPGILPIPSLRQALLIGCFQCVAMWPGTSRSLMAIVGGIVVGMGMRRAVEFSFLLGLLTLGAATAKDGLEFGPLMLHTYGLPALIVGAIAAFASAVFAVRWLVGYLNQHGLQVFGYYRIAIGLIVAMWLKVGMGG
jgi:undecaprenyl-diphosphatase